MSKVERSWRDQIMDPLEVDLTADQRSVIVEALRMQLEELYASRSTDCAHRLFLLELLEAIKEADAVRLVKE